MIKKCQADLELYAFETQDEAAKEMYDKNAKKLAKIADTLTPFLK